MDILSKAVDAIISALVNPVWENVSYPFNVSDNVRALDLATRELVASKADILSRVENAARRGMTQSNQVGQWVAQVEAVKEEADEIKRRCEQRSVCLCGRSLNCWSNYWISKHAAEKLKALQELRQKGQFEEVAIELPPGVQEFPVESEVVPKEQADLQSILMYIDSDCDGIIGIWGMGGVGKTRLLHLVHNSYKGSSAFELVIFVTASRECSIEKIQTELYEKYHIGQRGQDVESHARIISNYLRSHSFLLLIDDLWDRIDLQRVGIPHPLGTVNNFKRKVVITTRSSRVCDLMDVKRSHKVYPLAFNDAYRLFVEKIGEETISSHPHVPSLAREVVKELDGLPLALITIGRAMHGKKDPREWEDAIDLLQRSRLNEIELATRDEEKLYYRIKFSYDSLETEQLKVCFLACSLWPEDFEIPKEELIECWMGIAQLEVSNARNIYNPGYTLIGKLLSACLLEHAGSDSVKMHDVIRDMALWLSCDFGKQRDKWIVQSHGEVNQVLHEKDRWCNTEQATLLWPDKELESIPCQARKLHYLKVCHTKLTGPLVEKNVNLFSTLTFLDLSYCNLHYIPPYISNLVNLKYLNLSYNEIISIPEELKHLEHLMYLILRNNRIVSFPKGIISQVREVRVLSLYYHYLYGYKQEYFTWLIDELVYLYNIKSLEIILHHPTHLESLLKLPYLPVRYLEIQYFDEVDSLVIPGSFIANRAVQDNLFYVSIGGQSLQEIVIENDSGDSPCHLRNLEYLVFLEMSNLEEIIWKRVEPRDLFVKIGSIEIFGCNKLNDVSWVVYLPCLQGLSISRNRGMLQIIKQSSLDSTSKMREEIVTSMFPSLTFLRLTYLANLEDICDPSIVFPSLEYLHVYYCPRLKQLPFRPNTVPSNLKRIRGEHEWWEQLEWRQNDLEATLKPFFRSMPVNELLERHGPSWRRQY